ncbi:hypothetical protein [Streptacidiphilus cavernicola]|uniref:Uncharacterized protein n=1 Tax=Streptacidiphilus cavernicola TaxID=3342716 RepID=A0ABV6W219_9ACTN
MDPAVLAWLLAQLGTATDTADLTLRYGRLGTARGVVLEVLAERKAKLISEPLRLVVDGVVTLDNSANVTAMERQVAALADVLAPDETAADDTADDAVPLLVTAPLFRCRGPR